ncbi:hypothetical protein PtrM4_007440 [Pyrenophora tritici-repentis]|uniref:Uncharacterized protein n=1 Tax=Pyrenophora tritici-repentis TaxID=45151 RepID=A0A834VVU1_9PLEO|nr:hypothetical protein PtrM4_007440 [Pyrenophora tritici-repentis]
MSQFKLLTKHIPPHLGATNQNTRRTDALTVSNPQFLGCLCCKQTSRINVCSSQFITFILPCSTRSTDLSINQPNPERNQGRARSVAGADLHHNHALFQNTKAPGV